MQWEEYLSKHKDGLIYIVYLA